MSELKRFDMNGTPHVNGHYCNAQEAADIIEQQQVRIDELAATVDVLREYLRSLVEESTGVVGWHLNGAVADWDEIGATDILGETPQQNLNSVKREAAATAIRVALRNLGNADLNESEINHFADYYINQRYPIGKDGE